MGLLRLKTSVEQAAGHLRAELEKGVWQGVMPGVLRLEAETGVNRKILAAALQQLEQEGLLLGQGAGKRRKIVVGQEAERASLRVAMLLYEPADRLAYAPVELRHRLAGAGHAVHIAPKTMKELGMDVTRIARMVEHAEADAWVVVAGSRDVLEWFAVQRTPAFALFGRWEDLPLASAAPTKVGALHALVDRLVALGHRRIVLLVREDRRKPEPGFLERLFFAKLESCGIRTSTYHLPEWGDRPEDLQRVIDSLFRHTPPTALILGDVLLFSAVQQHLGRHGMVAPDHISLACTDAHPSFEWCRPTIAHIAWDGDPVIKRVLEWAENISRGREDRHQTSSVARFVEGGTIGPVP